MDTYQHILVIEDSRGHRAIHLAGTSYSIGRDPVNAIQLDERDVSRKHALLVRFPYGSDCRYQIVDGSADGKRSLNGIKVQGQWCYTHVLKDGDIIHFGASAKANYYIRQLPFEHLQRYTQTVPVRSLKAKPVSSCQTLQPASSSS